MAVLARTAPTLAATGCGSSTPLRPPASLSLAASSRPRGRVGLSTGTARARTAGRPGPAPFPAASSRPCLLVLHGMLHLRIEGIRDVVSLNEVEQTYIMIEPDGVQRGLVGKF